jgi:hypothetical protein
MAGQPSIVMLFIRSIVRMGPQDRAGRPPVLSLDLPLPTY